jgi:hypothetical protein
LLVGLAEALFLEESFGAAAELFATVLDRADPRTDASSRERALEWWASALDRYAQTREPPARAVVYEQIVDRMQQELANNPASATAVYWVAAGARGAGDPDRAWNAAVAAWVRSPLTRGRAVDLRDDLESLVTQGIIPDRVRRMPQAQRAQAAEQLGAEWTRIKLRWGQ